MRFDAHSTATAKVEMPQIVTPTRRRRWAFDRDHVEDYKAFALSASAPGNACWRPANSLSILTEPTGDPQSARALAS
jgi:hypothetical protein